MKKSIIIVNLIFFLLGCNNNGSINLKKNTKQNTILKSKKTAKHFLNDAKNDIPFDTILKKYYYDYQDILSDYNYHYMHKSLYQGLTIMLNSDDTLFFYWDSQIDSLEGASWYNHCDTCKHILLILNSKKVFRAKHYSICFTDMGKIYSSLVLNEHKTNKAVWLRTEKKYVRKEGKTIYFELPQNK